ncbi:class I poly(R)-hydroxyalkanoic acid synthase [Thiotrichales bacterium 19S3-7]|nr:class I poly(R)-hydroxyalkanoic acid synthase [Thiotrichales bacterium 19S3-7]MCF6801560.1 class I poly(R)-hydroxyalkanoic acid synthase [Thiotrichales bacterium 19S3-11]
MLHQSDENEKKDKINQQLLFNDAYFQMITKQLKNWSEQLANQDYPLEDLKFDHVTKVAETMRGAFLKLLSQNPVELWQTQISLWEDYTKLWQNAIFDFFEQSKKIPIVNDSLSTKHDRRFESDSWQEQPFFAFIKNCYLHTSDKIQGLISQIEGLDDKTSKEVEFYTRQILDAVSPSNFVLTNPDVLKETYDSHGQNLIKGFENMLEDLKRNQGSGVLNIKMTDLDQFKIGDNIARTKGKVIYQNRLFQLIQYSASKKEVYQKPLLIIPPFINKYYILDLTEKKSFVQWVVDKGYSVFMISWVNPDSSYKDTEFEDYMIEGVLEATEQVRLVTEQKTINVIGYCIGGTVLAAALSYLKKKKKHYFESATFFTTLIDFSDSGDLGLFLSEEQLNLLESEMQVTGYLDGRRLAVTFNLLRSNDLIWNYFINNYLCGKEPFPLDLLYWNSDSTNMAAKSHSYYLRQCYLKNNLIKENALTFGGETINIKDIDLPSIFISTEKDHIAPWKATYNGAKVFSGATEFVLAGSGHIAGIVNPPSIQKYGFKTNQSLAGSADQWYDSAKEHEGSWWVYWEKWLKGHSGKKIKALTLGNKKLKPIEDAPGSYVKVSILNHD